MSSGGDKGENNLTRAESEQVQVMDLDVDFDASGWAFDPVFFGHGAFLLPPSPPLPPQGIEPLISLPPPSPSSPLWPFEQRNDDGSKSNAEICESNMVNGISNGDVSRTRQFQIYPSDDSFDMSCIIKERMTQALRHFKESTDQHVLVQVWAPVRNGDRYVLTTSGQPFVLDPQSSGLLQYRTVSLKYMFSVDGDGEGYLGLPGRVFRQKLPEWSPNVQYYTVKEYPRLDYALYYNVRGTLALPVFEPSGQSCVGVVELIMTSHKINYAPEVDKVCKALEAVNLRSSDILDHPSLQICNDGRQDALAEILEILSVVCEEHKLPLAQTWVPCQHRNVLAHGGGLIKNCSSFDGSCKEQVCMSTTDVAFYVIDAHMWGFRDACVEHHLQKGQGVAGRAYQIRKPCFTRDVTQFCKTEYPLVHYAKMFGLASSLAICLQSFQTGDDDYILEFFLPLDCRDISKQHSLLDSISRMIKQHLRSLKVVTDVDLQEGISFDIIDMLGNDGYKLELKRISCQAVTAHAHTSPVSSPTEIPGDSKEREIVVSEPRSQIFAADNGATNQTSVFDSNGSRTSVSLQCNQTKKATERRRGKAEKSISLDVLQQYFAGSLKDAAKSLGVCPTTMKRICRQHGISRWPSRKINKVNRSLSKLKRVIESVQGAEGAFDLASLTCPLPVVVRSISLPLGLQGSNQINGALSSRETSPSKKAEYYRVSQPIHDRPASLPIPEVEKESTGSKSRSSSAAGSAESPHGSCHESPVTERHPDEQLKLERDTDAGDTLDLIPRFAGDSNLPTVHSVTNAIISESQPNIGGMLIEDSGSSKDLNNLCTSVGGRFKDESPNTLARSMSFPTAVQDMGIITIKAIYREDILRFRFPCSAGVVALKNEVAKRLKLEIGSFDVKYLDDDNEWVVLACNADLDECVEISRLAGGRLIRLAVQDIGTILGSSCESSG